MTATPIPTSAPALPSLAVLDAAAATVYAAMPPTPQYRWPLLEARTGVETWVKHENHTPVGAFKLRGGLVHLARLAQEVPRVPGVVTATRGNHGQSVGFAARRHGIPALVVVPQGNGREKNAAMRALGMELIEAGEDFQAAVETADALAFASGRAESHAVSTVLADGMACRTPVPDALALLRGEGGGPALARVVEVTDDEVAGAMRALFSDTHNAAEGAGAAALAALLQEVERAPELVRGRRVAVVLCGGNVDTDVFARVLAGSS